MKKILFVITKSNWGGAQRYVFDLATHLPQGYEPVVALGGTGNEGAGTGLLAEKLKTIGVRTVFVKGFMRDVSITKEYSTLRELIELFKKEQPDVVHLNSSKAGGLGALAARIAGVPKIVFTVHGLPWDEPRGPLAKALIYIATRLTFLLCHTVIAISKDNQRRAPGSVLIYNGIGPMQLGDGSYVRTQFPVGAKIVGTIGELNANKNQIALIEAARENPEMYVAIVGSGELKEFLNDAIKKYHLQERVKLLGFMPAADVLKGFDVFALPSLKEGLPYVLLEAKQAGLPIEANPVGGIPEILNGSMSDFTLEQMVGKTVALY